MNLHIAVILPAPYEGGVLKSAVNMAKMLVIGSKRRGDEVRVSFGYPKGTKFRKGSIESLENHGINAREFTLQIMPSDLFKAYDEFQEDCSRNIDKTSQDVVVFNDGMSNFEEADFYFIVSDNIPYSARIKKPYSVVVYDYVCRYYPNIFDENGWCLMDLRAGISLRANFIVATSNQTRLDVINFIGAHAEKVLRVPLDFDPMLDVGYFLPKEVRSRNRISWATTYSQHENHFEILESIELIVSECAEPIYIDVIGSVLQFSPEFSGSDAHPYIKSVAKKIKNSPLLRKALNFTGYLDDATFLTTIARSAFLLHSTRFDNGTYTAIEAARLGIPTLSADYAAMREIDEKFQLGMEFFDLNGSNLSEKIKYMINNQDALRKRMPSKEFLDRKTYIQAAPEFWDVIKSGLHSNTF